MEAGAGNAPRECFEANALAQNHCQNCLCPKEAQGTRNQEPRSPPSAEAPYCDLPRCPPAPEDLLSTAAFARLPVVGLGLSQGPERGSLPTAEPPDEESPAVPRSRHGDLEVAPCPEGQGSSCGSSDEDPTPDTSSGPDSNTPDDTSNSSPVDWHSVERQGEVPRQDSITVMLPRKPQEGPRADSTCRATRSPVRGDTTGQKREDTGGGRHSAGQHWAKLRRESSYFSLERPRSTLAHASSATLQSRPRGATRQAPCAQATSTQRDPLRASSPPRLTQKDNSRTSAAQQDSPTAPSVQQRSTPRTSSPLRSSQQNNPRTSSPQRNNPQLSSPLRAPQQDNLQTSFSTCIPQRESSRTSCAQRDNSRTSSPNRTTQREHSRTSCAQQDNARISPSNRTAQQDSARISPSNRTAQQDSARISPSNRTAQQDSARTSCAQRDNPRASSPNRTAQWDNPRTSCTQQNAPRASSAHRDNPKTSRSKWEHLRSAGAKRDTPHCSTLQRGNPGASSSQSCLPGDNPGPPSPHRTTPRSSARHPSPHRTNKDIPWASFPLRPTQSDGPRAASPSRSKQSEVPWASIALRPTQGDRPQASSPARSAQRDTLQPSCGSTQHRPASQAASSCHHQGQPSACPGSSAGCPGPRAAPQTSWEPSQPPFAVCIGHRDAPRASSPPRYVQHDPFPFFPDPRPSESEAPHHDPPYMPPAVCIGHRDAPRASSPPRYTQFDPFPFLPEASDDAGSEAPQHDPPRFPPPVCIGHRDAPRASSPPRQFPEPSLLQDLPRASTESLVQSTDSLHELPSFPTPVCIGHRDAPSFSSPPRHAPEPSLLFQDPPGTSMESLAPSTDSLHGSPLPTPQVCIGHRDAPRASSPPRHPPGDLAFLASSPPPGSSGGSRGSAPPGETRHNLEREEYTVLADLPPPRRLAQREPGPPAQGSNGGRTRSPGRAEVERLFGQERRKSETPGAFQARDEGRSQRPSQSQSQLVRRQSSPAPSRQVTKPPAKQAELARRSQAEPPHPRSPERRPQGTSPPPRMSARPREREPRPERRLERDPGGPRRPGGRWQSQEELPASRRPPRSLEEEDLGPGPWPGGGEPSLGAAGALEEARRGPPRDYQESWGQPEAWEEPSRNGLQGPPQRSWGSLQELSSLPQPVSPPDSHASWGGVTDSVHAQQPETPTAMGPERQPDLDWRDLLGLFRAPGEGAWARLPRLDWDGLLELLQARLPRRDPAGHWGDPAKASEPELGPPDTKDAPEQKQQSQPESLANRDRPRQPPQIPAQPPIPAYTSTQWPKTQVTSGPETSPLADLEPTGQREPHSPAEGSRPLEREVQPEEPEASEPSQGQDSSSDQEQADSADKKPAEGKAGSPLKGRLVTSWRMPGDRPTLFNPYLLSLGVLRWQRPDLLNFKKGWMSILDEPGEWKKHWFVLTDSSLKYYRDSTAEEADELDGEIDLRACTDVTEYAVQRNYGFQIHTKDSVYTLSAMTSGIRRNWIEALRKTVRPTTAPDVTKLSDSNKENTLHGYSPQKGSLKAGEPRGAPRKADGLRQSLDYVELSPLTQGSTQRARTAARTPDRLAKQEELERDLAQRSEERRKWFEATDSRAPETPTGEGPRRVLGAPLTEDQQHRLSEEIEKKWQELEKLPLRENKRVPLTALLNQGRGERRSTSSDSHEALEKEVQSLRAQLEACRLSGEASPNTPRRQEDGHIPAGYISQEACERSLAEMESSHQQVMDQLQRHHERELQRLQQEKEWLLAEETAATASAIEAMKKAYQEELSRELSKTRSLQQGPEGLRQQHQSDVEALKRELQVLSEQYSQKCLEIGALTQQAEEREHTLRRCQQEGQELLRHNQELHSCLSEEIDRLRNFVASQGTGNSCGRGGKRSSCELEVLLRVKENELQYLKKEVQCLRDELQTMQKDKRLTSGKYQDVYVELNHIKTRSEREIEQLKEHLRLAMAALREKEAVRNSLAE